MLHFSGRVNFGARSMAAPRLRGRTNRLVERGLHGPIVQWPRTPALQAGNGDSNSPGATKQGRGERGRVTYLLSTLPSLAPTGRGAWLSGRAPASHAGGRWFKSSRAHHPPSPRLWRTGSAPSLKLRRGEVRADSSAVRALALQARGHRFESCSAHSGRQKDSSPEVGRKRDCGAVVQRSRTLACHARDRGFESPRLRHSFALAQRNGGVRREERGER